jgi:hypothetical protein
VVLDKSDLTQPGVVVEPDLTQPGVVVEPDLTQPGVVVESDLTQPGVVVESDLTQPRVVIEEVVHLDLTKPKEVGSKKSGPAPDKYYMSIDCFQKFALKAGTKKGETVREFFVAIHDAYWKLQSGDEFMSTQTQAERFEKALLITFHNTMCIYLGQISASMGKFGITEDVQRRTPENKRTFGDPYSFVLIGVWSTPLHRKVETAFKNHPLVKGNMVENLVIDGKLQKEVFKFTPQFTMENARDLAAHLASTIRLEVMDANLQLEIERERELTKRHEAVEMTKRRERELHYDHLYRLKELKHRILPVHVVRPSTVSFPSQQTTRESPSPSQSMVYQVPTWLHFVQTPSSIYFSAYDIMSRAGSINPVKRWKTIRPTPAHTLCTYCTTVGPNPGLTFQGIV